MLQRWLLVARAGVACSGKAFWSGMLRIYYWWQVRNIDGSVERRCVVLWRILEEEVAW